MRRGNYSSGGMVMAGVLLCLACGAFADVSMDPVTWGSGGSLLGWSGAGDANAVTSPASGGNPDGYLGIAFDAADFPTFQIASVSNSGTGYTGNYSGLGLKFDLLGYAGSVHELFFMSSSGGSSAWRLTLVEPPVAEQTWQTFNVSFLTQGSWYRESGDEVDFLTALAQVDSIGLVVSHLNLEAPMQYGIDNWQFMDQSQLYVPEPGSMAMAAVVVLSALFWVRRSFKAPRP